MLEIIGLFTERISYERIQWLFPFLKSFFLFNKVNKTNIQMYLTGSALYSLLNYDSLSNWEDLANEKILIKIDQNEARKIGFSCETISESLKISNKIIWTSIFWDDLVKELIKEKRFDSIGYLQLESPYQNRTSVYAIQLLNAIYNSCIRPELYLYLDGLHMGLKNQNPSEFENIGNSIETLAENLMSKNTPVHFFACSRCATSRGYVKEIDSEGNFKSDYMIDPIQIINLKKIIERFGAVYPALSSNCFNIFNMNNIKSNKTSLFIFITHFPYDLEYTFGALSFAIASMNQGIRTTIIFIEDGVLALGSDHHIIESDKIFNIQDIIESTLHEENLRYYALEESINNRQIKINPKFKEISCVKSNTIANFILTDEDKFLHKIIFF